MGWLSRLLGTRPEPVPQQAFDAAVARLPILRGFTTDDLARLRGLVSKFMQGKHFTAAGGAAPDPEVALAIALQASLLILNLDAQSYRGWREIVLYPDAFLRPYTDVDEAGVVHQGRDILSGESWHDGPLILSISDVMASGQGTGHNVVLHEFAHKLDTLNGAADGFPPLHRGMRSDDWTRDFSAAFADLQHRVAQGSPSAIDPYATTHPAEFFAVLTEVFFETPSLVCDAYPEIYAQLRQFYRQDPLDRMRYSALPAETLDPASNPANAQ